VVAARLERREEVTLGQPESGRRVGTEIDGPPSPERVGVRSAAPFRIATGRGRAVFVRLFDQRSPTNGRLTVALAALVAVACVIGLPDLFGALPAGVDFEIMMRAGAHWSSGAPVYPASAMLVQSGPDLPYLYPPFLLPFLAPIASLPRDVITGGWLTLSVLVATWTCRRLAIPWLAVPFVLAWPPFAEGLITGNIQIICFAAFAALFYEPVSGGAAGRPLVAARDTMNGLLAAFIGVFKVAQILPVLYLARRRFIAAAMGVLAVVILALVVLPLSGTAVYWDWLAQLQRAANPAWNVGGVALGRLIGIPDLAMAGFGIVLALAARGRDSAAWLGIALIIATPSVHGYTFLFLLPGLLVLRRDLAILIATLFLGVYHGFAWWMATFIVAWVLIASNRWPWLRAVSGASRRSTAVAGSAEMPAR
jgi:hypothetical protein